MVYTKCMPIVCMENLEFVLGVLVILVSGFLIWSHIRQKTRLSEVRLAEELRVSADKRKYAAMKNRASRIEQESTSDVGNWVPELLNSFGISPEIIFQDEMPAELKKLLPLAKGFIDSGGVQKLLAGVQQPGPGDRQAI